MSTKLTKGKNGKRGITFFQQHNFRVVQLEFDKWMPLSKMIPNNLLQHIPCQVNPLGSLANI